MKIPNSKPTKKHEVLHKKPMILGLDLGPDDLNGLTSEKMNVVSGSFGNPYSSSMSSNFVPMIMNHHSIPKNVREFDVVIIDTTLTNKIVNTKDKHVSDDEMDWWVKCSRDFIDPRPRSMFCQSNDFEDIIKHGGIFIIFSSPRLYQEILFAKLTNSYIGLENKQSIEADNWSFLKMLSERNIIIEAKSGNEIVVDEENGFKKILNKYTSHSSYSCIFESTYQIEDNFHPLAYDKFGNVISFAISPHSESKGWAFIFPEINNKSDFLKEFINQVVVNIVPEKFPHIEGKKWVHNNEYELTEVLTLKEELEAKKRQFELASNEIEKRITDLYIDNRHFFDLIRESGEPLVKAVEKTLRSMGFTKILNVDEEKEKIGDKGPRNEDLQIDVEGNPLILIEVKGINGKPADEDALTSNKYVAVRMRSLNRTDVQALSIINHERHKPALERDNKGIFRPEVLLNAHQHQIGLLTTWDLFKLARSFHENKWKHEDIRDLFYKCGRIEPLPTHYILAGEILKIWEEKTSFGIKLSCSTLTVGQRIAVELNSGFKEFEIKSINIDRLEVKEAKQGQDVGIVLNDGFGLIRKKMQVYSIKVQSG